MPRTGQQSFSSGEIDPSVWGRTDLARYGQGLARCVNALPSVTGSIVNRPGTRYVANTKGDGPARLLPFTYSTEQTAILELGERSIRFHSQGAPLTVPAVAAAITNGDFAAGLFGWTDKSTGGALIVGAGSVLPVDPDAGTVIGTMAANGGLVAAFDGVVNQASSASAARLAAFTGSVGKDWGAGTQRTLAKVRLTGAADKGLRSGGAGRFIDVILEGSNDGFVADYNTLYEVGVANVDGQVVEAQAGDGLVLTTPYRYHRVRLVPGNQADLFVAELELFELSAGTGSMELRQGGAAGDVAAGEQSVVIPDVGRQHVLTFTVATSPATVQIGGSSGASGILAPKVYPPGSHTVSFMPGVSPVFVRFSNADVGTSAFIDGVALANAGGTAVAPLELATDYLASELRAIGYVQSLDVMTLTHPSHPPRELRRYGQYSWSLVDKPFAPRQQAPGNLVLTKNGTGSGTTHRYVVTAVAAEGGEESLPSVEADGNHQAVLDGTNNFLLSWDPAANAGMYSVYKFRAGVFGFIGQTSELSFKDDGLAPAIGNTPPGDRDPFDGPGKWPAVATYFEQRMAMAGSDQAPDTVELSQPAAWSNFTRSTPTVDSDAITATLASDERDRIVGMAAIRSLLLFTTGGVWRLDRGQNGLTPKLEGGISLQYRPGAAPLRPLIVGNAVLWVQAKGQRIRDLVYDFGSDSFAGDELSLLSRHLLKQRRVVEWAAAPAPSGLVWMVRDDGVLLALTNLREQQVVGWSRHATAGNYESVAAVQEGVEDAVYAVAQRLVEGTSRRFVERFASRVIGDVRDAYFVDAGVSYDRPATITGVALGDPLLVTAPGHGCAAGDLVELADVVPPAGAGEASGPSGTAPPSLATLTNLRRFAVADVAGDDLTLADQDDPTIIIDASAWPPWQGGGVVRRLVATVDGLDHLEGATVAILADGSVQENQVVVGGAVTIDPPAARIHVGLGYTSEIQTLPMALQPDIAGARKRVPEVQLRVHDTRGLWAGPGFDQLTYYPARLAELWGDPAAVKSELVRVTVASSWGDDAQLCLQQPDALPFELCAILQTLEPGG